MSLRAIGTRLFKHGTAIVRSLYKRELHANTIAEAVAKPAKEVAAVPQQLAARTFALRNVGLQVGLHARRLLVNSVLNRVTNSLAAELRRKAARRMLFGDSGPFFALVGISLASGTGILTKEDELEGICLEIRDAVAKINWQNAGIDLDEKRFETDSITLKDLELGPPIAKGCSAVVYAAKLIDSPTVKKEQEDSVKAEVNCTENTMQIRTEIGDALTGYPLAVKMMFNYDIQSSAMAILRAMYRETVPARRYYNPVGVSNWELDLSTRTIHIPAHPNIVSMFSVFADYVPELSNATTLYPAALPTRLHPEGSGRNMSLFLLMKRYDCSLQEFLRARVDSPLSVHTSMLLLTQLLEAVVHINMQGIAHRDLKSDNILLDLQDDGVPILVMTDFGCCLSDRIHGLQLPYNSMEIDRGGNTALMAPEVITQTPGTFTTINYSKSDLWAAACIAYEIFGLPNPFYSMGENRLRSADYKEEDLPELPDRVSPIIRSLIGNMLNRNPKKRLEPEVAANVCHLVLWGPSNWLKPEGKFPSSTELLQWLLCLTTKILCEGRLLSGIGFHQPESGNSASAVSTPPTSPPFANTFGRGRRTYPEYLLISSFLRRAKLAYVKSALIWIQNIN